MAVDLLLLPDYWMTYGTCYGISRAALLWRNHASEGVGLQDILGALPFKSLSPFINLFSFVPHPQPRPHTHQLCYFFLNPKQQHILAWAPYFFSENYFDLCLNLFNSYLQRKSLSYTERTLEHFVVSSTVLGDKINYSSNPLRQFLHFSSCTHRDTNLGGVLSRFQVQDLNHANGSKVGFWGLHQVGFLDYLENDFRMMFPQLLWAPVASQQLLYGLPKFQSFSTWYL